MFNKLYNQADLACEKIIKKYYNNYKYNDFLIAKFRSSYIELNSKIVKTYENMDKLALLLDKYCYIIPMNLSIFEINELAKNVISLENDKNCESKIDKIMLKLIKKDNWKYIEKLLDSFVKNKSLPSERIEILKSCLIVLRKNSMKNTSNVILPTLFAQIDGIWQDMFEKHNKKARLKEMTQESKNEYEKSCCKVLIEKLFKYTKECENVESAFCRNKVMHGEQLSYGNIFNVIKAFLLVEFLVYMKISRSE